MKEDDGIWLSKEEYEHLLSSLKEFSSSQRVSSMIIWIGLIMIILHIIADIGFHL